MYLYLPNNIKTIILKNSTNKETYLVLYKDKNYLTLKLNEITVIKNHNFLFFSVKYVKFNLTDELNHVFNWSNFYLKKILFKGKGYKIVKKKNYLILNFNHSHITTLLLFNSLCLKSSKNKYLLLLKNIAMLNSFLLNILNIRKLNIYTKRGIKVSKQKIYKKIGKHT